MRVRPSSAGLVELVGEDADGIGDGDVLGVEEVGLILPECLNLDRHEILEAGHR